MRSKNMGQKLDKYWGKLNRLWDDFYMFHHINQNQFLEKLVEMKEEIVNFIPQSEYERLDKQNLIDNIRNTAKDLIAVI